MYLNRAIIFIILILVYSSCAERIDDFSFEGGESKMTISAILEDGKPINVLVGKSLTKFGGTIQYNDLILDDATVFMEDVDQNRTILQFDAKRKLYTTNILIVGGRKYKIIANHKDFEQATSNFVFVPKNFQLNINSINLLSDSTFVCGFPKAQSQYAIDLSINSAIANNAKYFKFHRNLTNIHCALSILESTLCPISQNVIYDLDCYSDKKIVLLSSKRNIGSEALILQFSLYSEEYNKYIRSITVDDGVELGLVALDKTFTNINGGHGLVYGRNVQSINVRF